MGKCEEEPQPPFPRQRLSKDRKKKEKNLVSQSHKVPRSKASFVETRDCLLMSVLEKHLGGCKSRKRQKATERSVIWILAR